MKSLILFVFGLLVWGGTAQAVETSRMCTVKYQKCDLVINGGCAKWNNKAIRIHSSDARYICQDLRRRHGKIRNCNTRDCGRTNPPPPRGREYWQMETHRGDVIRRFGEGPRARYACEDELEYQQCRRGRYPSAACYAYYRGRVVDRVGPFCRR